ncbi:hypothetical protein PPSIR1_02381 [Plesiocystis pacifica SIR-1]|uniref:Membrane protein insertion efficiency factor YidD n=1 Tax=Plesiocystis pacifica SIR-1 TaxID=391625 RepID=A6G440_9BACT|nr:hypothetical protein [Plesiocystis pacifica]EDM79363.1 hypothetical protein PPSIR1_02381 [Plesiocystis pacifica SIR-1]
MQRAGLGALRTAILAYRRWASGRGPLRRVGCTFAHGESCSAYGLRMAETSPSLGLALARIRGRLHRCRGASVYRVHRGARRDALAWGCDHDEPHTLEDELCAARERPSTRAAVLAVSLEVARYRGRWALAAELAEVLARAETTLDATLDDAAPPAPLLVRRVSAASLDDRPRATLAWLAPALALELGVLALALPVLALAWWWLAWPGPLGLPLALSFGFMILARLLTRARARLELRDRLRRQIDALRFETAGSPAPHRRRRPSEAAPRPGSGQVSGVTKSPVISAGHG